MGGGARRQSGSERLFCFFFQAEDGIRDLVRSRGLGDVYKRQNFIRSAIAYYCYISGFTPNWSYFVSVAKLNVNINHLSLNERRLSKRTRNSMKLVSLGRECRIIPCLSLIHI